jgi:hypothetical protein
MGGASRSQAGFLLRILWRSDHPENNVAKFSCLLDMKVITNKMFLYSWLPIRTYHKNLNFFSLKSGEFSMKNRVNRLKSYFSNKNLQVMNIWSGMVCPAARSSQGE